MRRLELEIKRVLKKIEKKILFKRDRTRAGSREREGEKRRGRERE